MKKISVVIATFFIICTGALFLRQDSFGEISDKTAKALPATEWIWNKPGDMWGWNVNYSTNARVVNGTLQATTTPVTQVIPPPLSIDASQYGEVEFRLKSTISGTGYFFFSHVGENISTGRMMPYYVAGDGQFHTYKLNLRLHPLWKGTITGLRIDPPHVAGANIEIQYFRFIVNDVEGIVPNGGFEWTDAIASVPEDWEYKNISYVIVPGKNSVHAIRISTGLQNGQMQSALFEFPETGRYQLTADVKSSTIMRGTIVYFNVFHQLIKTQPLIFNSSFSSDWQRNKSTFDVPDLAAYGEIIFDVPSNQSFTLDNISLTPAPVASALAKPWEECWRANWITAPGAGAQPDAARYFRHSFTVPDVSTVTFARLQVTADNSARVEINGQELPPDANWDNWKLVDVYDVKPYLQNGQNVVGIIAHNEGGAEGVLAELNIQWPNGHIDIISGKNWRSFVGRADDGWSKSTFDDSNWKPADEIGAPPVAPWGELPYHYLGRTLPLRVTSYKAISQAQLGQKISVRLACVPRVKPDHAIALKLQLVPAGDSDSTIYDFPLIPLNTSLWAKGKPVHLTESLQLPKYFQPGNYLLKAGFTFAAWEGDVPATQAITLYTPRTVLPPVTKLIYLPGHIPAFVINGKTFPVMHVLTEPNTSDANKFIVKNSHDSGINLIWFNVTQGFDWKPDAPATFREMDQDVNAILEDNPAAYIVLNVPLSPDLNPGMGKWLGSHPEQVVKGGDGTTNISGYDGLTYGSQTYASFASQKWMNDASQSWRELIRHVRSSPYAGHVIGYVPIAGPAYEWWYYGAQKNLIDYSEPFRQAFANWAEKQYHGDLALLNKTWNTNYPRFDAIQIPSKTQRWEAAQKPFLNPAQDGQIIDLREFINVVISDDILQFCHIVKEETNGNAICGTYYGYVMSITAPRFAPQSGHYALEKVISSPDIDFIMSPSPYWDRGLGGGSGFMTTVDSVKLHQKLYINQSDIRTFLSYQNTISKLYTIKDSVSVLKRQFCDAVVNGVATQWYDFGTGWITGDKRLMQAIGKMYQIEKQLQHMPRDTIDPQNSIAVITDEKSILYSQLDSWIQSNSVTRQVGQLNRCGVAWDSYLLSDLPKISGYHYYLFLNCFNLSNEQKMYIDTHLKKAGNVLVWVNAAGIIRNEDKGTFAQAAYNPKRVSEVTGFGLKQLPDGVLETEIMKGDNLLQWGISSETTFGAPRDFQDFRVIGTRFSPQDGVALGHFVDNNQTSLAVKKFSDWTSVYSAAPDLPAAFLRNIARMAKVPVINDVNGDITYASKKLFSVHGLAGGDREFHVGANDKTAIELFSGHSYAVHQGIFSAKIPAGGTVLFLLKE